MQCVLFTLHPPPPPGHHYLIEIQIPGCPGLTEHCHPDQWGQHCIQPKECLLLTKNLAASGLGMGLIHGQSSSMVYIHITQDLDTGTKNFIFKTREETAC